MVIKRPMIKRPNTLQNVRNCGILPNYDYDSSFYICFLLLLNCFQTLPISFPLALWHRSSLSYISNILIYSFDVFNTRECEYEVVYNCYNWSTILFTKFHQFVHAHACSCMRTSKRSCARVHTRKAHSHQ